MLAGVCIELASRGWDVSVVGRDQAKLTSLSERGVGRIHPISTDYQHPKAFLADIQKAIARFGQPAATIAWIHSGNDDVVQGLLDLCREGGSRPVFIHVLSSSQWTQRETIEFDTFLDAGGIDYRRVYLGWVEENNARRWLTHEEICRGVLDAIHVEASVQVVGTLDEH